MDVDATRKKRKTHLSAGVGPSRDYGDDLRLLADSTHDVALIFTDSDRRIVGWSAGAEHILGWTVAEATNTNTIDLIFTPEDRDAGVPQREQDEAVRDGRAEDDRWHQKKNGARFWANGVITPLYDPETGDLRGFGKILRDMTVEKEREDRRRVSEARLAAIFARAAVGLSEIGLDGRFLAVNDELCRILGRSRAELLDSNVPSVTHPEDLPASLKGLKRTMETGGAVSLDKRYLRPDGTIIWASSSLTLLRGDEGAPMSVLAVTVDLTERKHAEAALRASEAALRRANETLEERVEERTADLRDALISLEIALTDRQTLLRRVVGTQEQERRRISRELHDQTGQHLTGLALGLEALEKSIEAYCPRETGAASLLDQLRGISAKMAMDIHRVAVELRPTALDDMGLVPALRSHLEQWTTTFGITAEFDCFGLDAAGGGHAGSPRLPELVETTVYRVVQEALTNVARHCGDGSNGGSPPRASVTLQRFANYLQVTVEDNGPGFDVEAAQGSGRLGLAGMQERAAACGGTLQIESAPGSGTTVFLRIPGEHL